MATRRALHFVFKVADRTGTAAFYRETLGMKILRHEEFEEGCKASCNGTHIALIDNHCIPFEHAPFDQTLSRFYIGGSGPYDGMWSKSMVGYGAEDNHFVVELTYNYGVKNYKRGNDFQHITIYSKDILERVKQSNYTQSQNDDGAVIVEAPGGYPFHIYSRTSPRAGSSDPVYSITLSVSNFVKSLDYWSKMLGMNTYSQTETSAVLGYADDQAKLELVEIAEPINHAEAFGRIAFSCPSSELPGIEQSMKAAEQTVLTPLVSLDTPGKATVQVVILADPDGHEICFVGDEGFRELSRVDPNAEKLINDAIAADKSEEWFAKKHGKK